MTDAHRPLIERICEGIDAELTEITESLDLARAAARLASEARERGDLLAAAQYIRQACNLEYGALGDCDYCGELHTQIQRAHVGPEGEWCDAYDAETEAGCPICAALIGHRKAEQA